MTPTGQEPRRSAAVPTALLFVLLTLPSGAPAQDVASVLGRAMTDDGTPAPEAVIRIRSAGLVTRPDADGRFRFTNLNPGVYRVEAMLPEHAVVVEETTVPADGAGRVTLRLIPLSRLMEDLRVVASPAPVRGRHRGGSRTVLRYEELGGSNASTILEALVGKVPGTRIEQSGGRVGGFGRIRIRGPRSLTQGNDPLVFVDGIRVAGPNPARLLASMDPASVDSVQVLRGPEATGYGSGSAAGVILVHTHHGGRSGGDGGGDDRPRP